MITKKKQPSEIIDYEVSMEDHFEELPGDGIASVVATIEGNTGVNDLLLGPGLHPETVLLNTPATSFKIWVGGGDDGTTYKVTSVITTDDGRVREHEFEIKVKDK